jgi:hypothetical protein
MCGTSRLSEGNADTTKRWYLGYMKHCTIENCDGQTSWFNIVWGSDSQSCRQFQRNSSCSRGYMYGRARELVTLRAAQHPEHEKEKEDLKVKQSGRAPTAG